MYVPLVTCGNSVLVVYGDTGPVLPEGACNGEASLITNAFREGVIDLALEHGGGDAVITLVDLLQRESREVPSGRGSIVMHLEIPPELALALKLPDESWMPVQKASLRILPRAHAMHVLRAMQKNPRRAVAYRICYALTCVGALWVLSCTRWAVSTMESL